MIISALEDMFQPLAMQQLLNRFIQHFKYSSYSSSDFEYEIIRSYREIGGEAKNMKSFITSWTHLPGLPLIKVIPTYSSSYHIQRITLLQVILIVFSII